MWHHEVRTLERLHMVQARLVTGPMPTGIDQDQAMIIAERPDIPVLVPGLQAVAEAMREDQGWSSPLHAVVDAEVPALNMRHGTILILGHPRCEP
jgi:hypothetical protein